MQSIPSDVDRFFENCRPGPGECIVWVGRLGPNDRITWDKKTRPVVTVAWELCWGKLPSGQKVRRKCATPRCVHVEHLSSGYQSLSTVDILSRLVLQDTGCAVWTGAKEKHGYGMVWTGGQNLLVHRVVYERIVGVVPKGMELHHTCENPSCSNWTHLVPLTRKAHCQITVQANSKKTYCLRGHPFDEANTYHSKDGKRYCRICRRYRVKKCFERKKSLGGDQPLH